MLFMKMYIFIKVFIALYLSQYLLKTSGKLFEQCPFIQQEINYYENLINNAEETGLSYELPKDARKYEPNAENILEFGSFDFIIIGSGAAGSVVANRLSSYSDWTILLLEAGTFGNKLTDIPGMYFDVDYTEYNWGFFSVPQNNSCLGMVNNKCPLFRGRGIGGTTLIDGLVYSRGSSLDFDHWSSIGNPGWSYDEVLPLFMKSENYHHTDHDAPLNWTVHGALGPLNVEYHIPRSTQLNAFLAANQKIGTPVRDYNSGTGLGASPAQITTKNGVRFDNGKAFVRPVLYRKNLKLSLNSYVMQIMINDNNEATGVLFSRNNQLYRALATREVILSAGTYQSAQLLMLSGIGLSDHLESLNISVKSNLSVGFFTDHPTFYGLNFETNYTEPIKPLSDYVCEYLGGYGQLAAPGNNQGIAFYESSFTKGTGLADIEIMMIPANATTPLSRRAFNLREDTYNVVWGNNNPANTFIFYVICLHALSVGTIRLNSSNPFDYPIIDPRFLTDPSNRDINILYEGIQIALALVRTEAFQRLNVTLQGGPLKACLEYEYPSEDYWYCAIPQLTLDLYHPVGSAKMGPNPEDGAVVDHECKVHGIKKLRVADASVIPFTLAGHTNAPTVMIGEKVSDLIISQHL